MSGNKITVKAPRKCMFCGERGELEMLPEEFEAYSANEGHIQDAAPSLSPDERELLISGTHPKCWEENFG